jgi:hypothetical protein
MHQSHPRQSGKQPHDDAPVYSVSLKLIDSQAAALQEPTQG